MCKHILNAQVSIRAQCCKAWYDCPDCHNENNDHEISKSLLLTMACKKCKKVFRKDMGDFDENDEYCPHCDNHYLIKAIEPKAALAVEFDENVIMDSIMIGKDKRAQQNK
eukprot:GHVP01053840.1.p1 GENE.GHVP01053840.1~~GHVP01053840.1.p1  ORF type:complete len:110 (+),score=14.93 GHVP01053840.1:2-331(+)